MASGFIYAAQCSIDWTVAQGGALRSERMMKYVTQEGGGRMVQHGQLLHCSMVYVSTSNG